MMPIKPKTESSQEEKDIQKRISDMHDAELESDKHLKASVEQSDNLGELSSRHQDLILLSRVITGSNDVCSATCVIGDKLLIANNRSDSKYANKYMEKLSAFIEKPFMDEYDALETHAKQNADRIRTNKKTIDRIREISRKYPENPCVTNCFDSVDELKDAISKGVLDANTQKLAAEILQPILDSRELANKIVRGELDSNLINAIRTYDGRTSFISNKEGLHAEMQITEEAEHRNNLQGIIEIGISKRCCCPCHVTMELINEKKQQLKEDGEIALIGTHGGTYKGWIPPRIKVASAGDILEKLNSLRPGQYPKGPKLH